MIETRSQIRNVWLNSEYAMNQTRHDRFYYANQLLRRYLRRIEGVLRGTGTICEVDLPELSQRLSNCDFSVGESSRGEILDANLQKEIGEYVTNLLAVQNALERVRRAALTRRRPFRSKNRSRVGSRNIANTFPTPG